MESLKRYLGWIAVFVLLYFFLTSIDLIGVAFKLFGKDFALGLIKSTSNPFVALFVGLLSTSIIQSSSTTTSITVGLVAAGVLPIENAIPIVMGANIGTSVTNMLVSLGHITRSDEFERAFSGAIIHDFFNLITAFVLLPVELATGYLQRTAECISKLLVGVGGGTTHQSPLKLIVKPVAHGVEKLFVDIMGIHARPAGILILILSLVTLFFSLFFLVRLMKILMMNRLEIVFDRYIARNDVIAFVMGLSFTVLVQSSSVTTSLLVPLLAAGVLTLEQAFPMTLGANLGTTITALLASMVGNVQGLTIAIVHLLFNISGILLIYPIRPIRRIPIAMARWMGYHGTRKKWIVAVFILGVFFIIPGLLILISYNL
ncbi:MAG TPA: Na/Pi symporter [Thermoanaerobaculia bacterium]|nr:Na/Pi symporter [Thermoanaerobaculia bacterium]HUM29530.1 Na/Pi symporter [Thermoanaerobaculia bacterium]HXK67913.1 Na/Pi symporter [Thermoanaerobaculia bacterium]